MPPTAVADSYTFTQGSPLVSSPRSVLDNDISPQGKVLTAQLVGKPSHGSLGLNPDGTFTYTPDPNSTSSDSFSYDAVDAGGLASQPTTVTLVEASPAPLPPTSADDSFATAQEKTISIADPGVLANDTGSGTAPLIAVLQANAAHGTLQLSGGGGFSYTPDPGFHGVDSFSYLATQGGLKAASTATVTIDVSQVFHAAVAVDDLYAGSEGQALSIPAPGVLANDTIVDSPAPSITASLVAAPLHGTVALQADGSFVYTPGAGFSGPDSFSYRDLASGLTGNVATVSLTVAAVAPPPSANPVAFTTTEGQPINVGGPGVLLGDAAAGSTTLSAVLQSNPQHGSLALNADGSFTYTPTAGFSGTDSFTFDVSDGVRVAGPATATLTVTAAPQPPTSVNLTFSTMENSTLQTPSPGVLKNTGTGTTALLISPTRDGVLELNPDGSFTYTPNLGFAGADSFTYAVSQGSLTSAAATATIEVTPVPATVVQLSPISVTGPVSGGLTRIDTPTFTGTTAPNATVTLSASSSGGTPVTVGRAVADALGAFTITSNPLPDGTYQFAVAIAGANGTTTGSVNAGPLTIVSTAPRVSSAVLLASTGQVQITFQAGDALNTVTLADGANYSLFRQSGNRLVNVPITAIRLLPTVGFGFPAMVIFQVGNGRGLAHGTYLLQLISGGIKDVAGNSLDGAFSGTYPSGDGQQGSNFKAQFAYKKATTVAAAPTSADIPILNFPPSKSPAVTTTVKVSVKKTAVKKVAVKVAASPRTVNHPTTLVAQTIAGPLGLSKKSKKAK